MVGEDEGSSMAQSQRPAKVVTPTSPARSQRDEIIIVFYQHHLSIMQGSIASLSK